MLKKLLLGIVIGAFFVYLSFKGVDLGGIAAGLESAKLPFIIPALCLLVLMQMLRSYRWGIILKPIMEIDQFSLFSVTSVGFLAMVTIPARIGEFARPYLISTKTGISMSSAVGTVLVERVFDGLTVLTAFFIVVLFTPLPPWLIRSSLIFLFVVLAFLGLMVFLIFKKEASLKILSPILKIFPEGWHLKLMELIDSLIDGFKIIPHRRSMCYLAFLSIVIWAINAVTMYVLFFAFDLDLPLSAAFALMVIIILGIAIPTAPGFIGNWHFFCVLGLGLFGIHKTDALVYAIVLHFLSIGIVVVLGLAFLPFNKFSLSDIRRRFSMNRQT
ncbi:MAG: flippase-like domain-containing protein [Deltaproteobacteria bacterium]|nr:flippase-like domain-containing protein [Deltaproteobacteria bacterium]MBW2595802.1 flippase-like domain-containing protein [Deltaproteobacteria bacterium]MBW2650459.1 flippase-like domain-containing protein [Deltaproteobacteria bacterium]